MAARSARHKGLPRASTAADNVAPALLAFASDALSVRNTIAFEKRLFQFRPAPASSSAPMPAIAPASQNFPKAGTAPRSAAGGGWRKPDFQSVRRPSLGVRPRGVDVVAAPRVSITDWRRPRHHHGDRNRQSVTATMPLGCSNLDRPQPHTAALFIQCAGMVTMAPGGISVLARAKRI